MAKPTKETKKINPLLEDEKPVKGGVMPVEESIEEEEQEEEEAEEVVTPKKVATSKPVVKVNVADEAMSDAQTTEKKLKNEEQIMFMVPLAEGEKKGAVHECFINGFKYSVPKGVMTKIPTSVANLLAEHYKIGMEAGADYRLDMNQDKLDSLS